MLNLKQTHRATTAMREAFEKSVRLIGWKSTASVPDVAIKVSDAMAHNAGVYRRPDVSLNVTAKTWAGLKQIKAV